MIATGDGSPATVAERPVVLLVDDNAGFLRVLRAVLEHGAPQLAVVTVGTGHEALAYLRGEPPFTEAARPDFVVLDFHLPDIDAPDVLSRLRSSDPDVPVLVLSQADWLEDEEAALGAGASAFRAKPSSLAELHGIVVDFWRECGRRD